MNSSDALRELASVLRENEFYRDSERRLQTELTPLRLASLCEQAAERVADDEWMERMGDDL